MLTVSAIVMISRLFHVFLPVSCAASVSSSSYTLSSSAVAPSVLGNKTPFILHPPIWYAEKLPNGDKPNRKKNSTQLIIKFSLVLISTFNLTHLSSIFYHINPSQSTLQILIKSNIISSNLSKSLAFHHHSSCLLDRLDLIN